MLGFGGLPSCYSSAFASPVRSAMELDMFVTGRLGIQFGGLRVTASLDGTRAKEVTRWPSPSKGRHRPLSHLCVRVQERLHRHEFRATTAHKTAAETATKTTAVTTSSKDYMERKIGHNRRCGRDKN
ncbi:hypothetical protein RUM43_000466 [Polyplax serrata]|uniref:Uncharacterized protein n=1 Tax=Polyplax serrata TaxID=468196 RepID=A0AAN8XNM2_POLSC